MLNGLAAQQMDFAIWQYLASPHMSSGHIRSGPAFGFALDIHYSGWFYSALCKYGSLNFSPERRWVIG